MAKNYIVTAYPYLTQVGVLIGVPDDVNAEEYILDHWNSINWHSQDIDY